MRSMAFNSPSTWQNVNKLSNEKYTKVIIKYPVTHTNTKYSMYTPYQGRDPCEGDCIKIYHLARHFFSRYN